MRRELLGLWLGLLVVAHGQEIDTERLCRDDGWYDLSAFAGARHTFFEDENGLRVRYVIFGSGEPIISDQILPVTVSGDTLSYGAERVVFDSRAGVLRTPWFEGHRMVPGGPVDYAFAPLLAGKSERALEEALEDADTVIRREALAALVDERNRRGFDGFAAALPLLGDPEPSVRARAAWALSACRERAGVEGILALLGDEDPGVRCAAARALGWGSLGGSAAVARLHTVQGDPVPEVRAAADWALGVLLRK